MGDISYSFNNDCIIKVWNNFQLIKYDKIGQKLQNISAHALQIVKTLLSTTLATSLNLEYFKTNPQAKKQIDYKLQVF